MNDWSNDRLVNSAGPSGRRAPRIMERPPRGETFSDRVWRLCLNSQLGRIGVGQWKHLMDRHRGMTDHDLLAAVDDLERKRPTTQEGN